jgi:hypothetical protein
MTNLPPAPQFYSTIIFHGHQLVLSTYWVYIGKNNISPSQITYQFVSDTKMNGYQLVLCSYWKYVGNDYKPYDYLCNADTNTNTEHEIEPDVTPNFRQSGKSYRHKQSRIKNYVPKNKIGEQKPVSVLIDDKKEEHVLIDDKMEEQVVKQATEQTEIVQHIKIKKTFAQIIKDIDVSASLFNIPKKECNRSNKKIGTSKQIPNAIITARNIFHSKTEGKIKKKKSNKIDINKIKSSKNVVDIESIGIIKKEKKIVETSNTPVTPIPLKKKNKKKTKKSAFFGSKSDYSKINSSFDDDQSIKLLSNNDTNNMVIESVVNSDSNVEVKLTESSTANIIKNRNCEYESTKMVNKKKKKKNKSKVKNMAAFDIYMCVRTVDTIIESLNTLTNFVKNNVPNISINIWFDVYLIHDNLVKNDRMLYESLVRLLKIFNNNPHIKEFLVENFNIRLFCSGDIFSVANESIVPIIVAAIHDSFNIMNYNMYYYNDDTTYNSYKYIENSVLYLKYYSSINIFCERINNSNFEDAHLPRLLSNNLRIFCSKIKSDAVIMSTNSMKDNMLDATSTWKKCYDIHHNFSTGVKPKQKYLFMYQGPNIDNDQDLISATTSSSSSNVNKIVKNYINMSNQQRNKVQIIFVHKFIKTNAHDYLFIERAYQTDIIECNELKINFESQFKLHVIKKFIFDAGIKITHFTFNDGAIFSSLSTILDHKSSIVECYVNYNYTNKILPNPKWLEKSITNKLCVNYVASNNNFESIIINDTKMLESMAKSECKHIIINGINFTNDSTINFLKSSCNNNPQKIYEINYNGQKHIICNK